MQEFIGKLGERVLSAFVPELRASAVDCYYATNCIGGWQYRAYCCNGNCGPWRKRYDCGTGAGNDACPC